MKIILSYSLNGSAFTARGLPYDKSMVHFLSEEELTTTAYLHFLPSLPLTYVCSLFNDAFSLTLTMLLPMKECRVNDKLGCRRKRLWTKFLYCFTVGTG
jgi:hypothetical protein